MESQQEITVNRDISVTLYHQVKDILLQNIINNFWRPGNKIPSEKLLCSMYGVSRITVRKAIDELVRSGHLTRHQGKGTFVANVSMEHRLSKFYSFSEELAKKGLREHVRILSFDIIDPDDKISENLSLDEDDKVIQVTRLRMVDETPYTIENSYIPYNLFPELTEISISKNGLYNTMRMFGISPDRAIEKFNAAAISKSDAMLLQTKASAPAIHLERVTFGGKYIIEYCNAVIRGDSFTYTVELRS